MKKLMVLMLAAIIGIGTSFARDRVTSDSNVLPAPAKEILNKHFPKVGVNHIKIDQNLVGQVDDYDVILNDGSEVEFDRNGNVKSVDCGSTSVPEALVLKPIRDYVAKNFKGAKIVGIETNRKSYEIELSSGMELKFDRSGAFLKIDD